MPRADGDAVLGRGVLDRLPAGGQDSFIVKRAERPGLAIRIFALVIRPLSALLTRRRWSGGEHIPATGGVILAVNHISLMDPPLLAHYVYVHAGRNPRFMAKGELWNVPVFGRLLRGAGQIPVHRRAATVSESLRDAVAALRAGRLVIVYPEGTITRDPDLWPMRVRTGVARLALESGAPVVPVAQWGAHRMLPRGGAPRLWPRAEIMIEAGPPVDLSEFAAAGLDADPRAVSDRIMADVAAVLARHRQGTAPAGVWDPRTGRRELAATGVDVPVQAGSAELLVAGPGDAASEPAPDTAGGEPRVGGGEETIGGRKSA
jgi:1-acyl-sn-glycerol-3-phosphate acyltransferase